MPVVVIPPTINLPKQQFSVHESSTNRLFENNMNFIPPRPNNIVHPTLPQIPFIPPRPMTPPIVHQNFRPPVRPLSPIQNININPAPVQIRSIIY